MQGQPVTPVYDQMSTIRDDLLRRQMMPLPGGMGSTGMQSDMVSMILNPVPPPSPMMSSSLYETSIYGARISSANAMSQLYKESAEDRFKAESTFDSIVGGVATAAFMTGHPIVGMGLYMAQEPLKQVARSLNILPTAKPVFGTAEMTEANVASQIHQAAFANLDPFTTGGDRGVSVEAAKNLAPDVVDFMRDQGFQGLEMGRLTGGAAAAGTFNGAENIEQITGRLKEYIKTVANFVKETGASLEEAGQVAAVGTRMGVSTGGMSDYMRTMSAGANIGGVSAIDFMQMGASVVQPFAQSGVDLSPAMSALTWDTASMRTMSSMGMVSKVAMQQVGGSAAAAANMNQMAMNYWTTPANNRRAAAMSMNGGWDADMMDQIVRGEGFPDDYMDSYNNADINDRLTAQWNARENIVNNSGLASEAMLGTTFARMEEMDITDPIAQQQQLTNWGWSPAMAQVAYAQHAAVGDPGLQVRTANRSLLLQREQAVAAVRNTGRSGFRNLVAMGAVISKSSKEREELIGNFSGSFDGDYGSWARDAEMQGVGGAMYTNNSLDMPNLRGRSRIYAGTLDAVLGGYSAEERAMIGPQIAAMFNRQSWKHDTPSGRDSSVGSFNVGWNEETSSFTYTGMDIDRRSEVGDITDDVNTGRVRYFLEESVVDELSDDVERVLDQAVRGVPGGPGTTLERIVPTVGQATIMASAYASSSEYRGAIGGLSDLDNMSVGPWNIPVGARTALKDAALVPRLLTHGSSGSAQAEIHGLAQGSRRREIYEQLATSETDFTSGLTRDSSATPSQLAGRISKELYGEDSDFFQLGTSAQNDIINVMGAMYPGYGTQTEGMLEEVTRRSTNAAENFSDLNKVDTGMTESEMARHRYALRRRISAGSGLELSAVDDTLMENVGYLSTAVVGNKTSEWALDQLGLVGEERTNTFNAYRAAQGYNGMTASELAVVSGDGAQRSRLSYVRSTLVDSLSSQVLVDGEAIQTGDIDQLMRGESAGDITFASGASQSVRDRYGSLADEDKLTEALYETILAEQTDSVTGPGGSVVGPDAFNMETGNMTVAATGNVNIYTDADMTNISSIGTGVPEEETTSGGRPTVI